MGGEGERVGGVGRVFGSGLEKHVELLSLGEARFDTMCREVEILSHVAACGGEVFHRRRGESGVSNSADRTGLLFLEADAVCASNRLISRGTNFIVTAQNLRDLFSASPGVFLVFRHTPQ